MRTVPFINTLRFHLGFAFWFMLVFLGLNWFILGESSPLGSFFYHHAGLANFWTLLHVIPLSLGFLVSGDSHHPQAIATIILAAGQWFVVGYALSFIFNRLSASR